MPADVHQVLTEAAATPSRPPEVEALWRRGRQRRRRRIVTGALVALVIVGAVTVGITLRVSGPNQPSVSSPATPAPAHSDPCASSGHRSPTPADRVPPQVKTWAMGVPVIGAGAIWTIWSAVGERGATLPDGTYLIKVPWYLLPAGHTPTITSRRLDGPGIFHFDTNVASEGGTVFATSTLNFSTPGCWQVTGRYLKSAVTFRVHIARKLETP
jgi:hypothetical protein